MLQYSDDYSNRFLNAGDMGNVPVCQSFSEETSIPETRLGTMVGGKYRLIKTISKSTFLEIYLALYEQINQVVTVKVYRKEEKYRHIYKNVLHEASLLMKLSHPAIPTIYDILEDESCIYIILESITGETLDVLLRRSGAQPAEIVIGWAKQLCDVLSYLHNQNPPYIYGDMKPANIWLRPDGNLCLIEFVAMGPYRERNNSDTIIRGTRGYAAPEQFGGCGPIDARTDIFGLGMTMHHLLTGVDPNEPPYIVQPIRRINPQLPGSLEKMIGKCTEPSPNERYQTVEELLAILIGQKPEPRSFLGKIFGRK